MKLNPTVFALGLLGAYMLACTSSSGEEVTRGEYGARWPLTVDEARVRCDGIALYLEAGGTTYALNGVAKQQEFPVIDPIWADNPEIPGTKINIGPLLERAQQTCR